MYSLSFRKSVWYGFHLELLIFQRAVSFKFLISEIEDDRRQQINIKKQPNSTFNTYVKERIVIMMVFIF